MVRCCLFIGAYPREPSGSALCFFLGHILCMGVRCCRYAEGRSTSPWRWNAGQVDGVPLVSDRVWVSDENNSKFGGSWLDLNDLVDMTWQDKGSLWSQSKFGRERRWSFPESWEGNDCSRLQWRLELAGRFWGVLCNWMIQIIGRVWWGLGCCVMISALGLTSSCPGFVLGGYGCDPAAT